MKNDSYVPQFQVRSHVRSGEGGGYVNGVWYGDRSGVCGGFNPAPIPQPLPQPQPQPSAGGYISGVWYGDRSGVCGS